MLATAGQQPVPATSVDTPIDFIKAQVLPAISDARRLRTIDDDESQPYKSKYACSDLLTLLEQQAAALAAAHPEASTIISYCIAHCQLERGLALLETDMVADGQRALEQALQFAWPPTLASYAAQQQAHNALGGLWCSREEFDASLQHLKTAAELYSKAKAILQDSCGSHTQQQGEQQQESNHNQQDQQLQQPAYCSVADRWVAELADVAAVEPQYTTTLYYLAQVHGHAGDKVLSASYCAATLNRQVKAGSLNVSEWVQNCLQLSGYFLDGNAFALSQYCCAAVEKMLMQHHQKQQQGDVAQFTVGSADSGQQQQQEGATMQQPNEQLADASATSESSSSVHAEVAAAKASATDAEQGREQQQQQELAQQDEQHKDQTQKQQQMPVVKPDNHQVQQQQQQQGHQQHARGTVSQLQAALHCLDEDVAANVCLAMAKLHLYTLVASHELHVEGKQLSYSYARPCDVPDVLRLDALPGMPELADLAWGDAALAASPDAARVLLKDALPWFRAALEYYKLEGWVTEHCNILFEMSNLYRCLAGFEVDPHKRCVMHRSRAKLLQPLEGQLSQQHYPGLARSISLELGNIFREIGDIKAAAGREPDKVAAAAVAASLHYQLFLDSFKSDDGQLPAKVEADMEQHYLSAAFCMARVLQAGAVQHKEPSAHATTLEQAVHWLDTLVAYVEHNSVAAWEQEASMAAEMAALLKEKLALTNLQLTMQQRLRVGA